MEQTFIKFTVSIILIFTISALSEINEKESFVLFNDEPKSIYDISSYSHILGTSSAIFYGMGSGYLTFADIIVAYKYSSNNKNLLFAIGPTSAGFLTASSLNFLVKKRRKKRLLELGVEKPQSDKLINIGIVIYGTSIISNFLYNISYISNNSSLIKSGAIINSSILTISFVINLIAKVKQGIELNSVARKIFLEQNKISFFPYGNFSKESTEVGLLLKF